MHKRVGGGKKAAGVKPKSTGPIGPSTSWKSLLASTALMCQMVGHEDPEMGDQCQDTAGMISSYLTKKPSHQNRMEMIEIVTEAIDSFMIGLSSMKGDKATQVELDKLLDAMYSSSLGVLGEALSDAGEESESKAEMDAESEATALFGLLETLLANTILQNSEVAKAIFKPHFTPMSKLCLELGTNAKRDVELRESAFKLLSLLIEAQPDQVVSENLVEPIVDVCFQLCGASDESENETHDDDEDEEEEDDVSSFQSQNVGTQTLDQLAVNLSDKQSIASMIHTKSKSKFASTDKSHRKAAVLALAVLPEACSTYVKSSENLDSIFEMIMNGVKDSEASVRAAGFIAASEYIEHAQPNVSKYHEALHEIIMKTLANKEENVITRIKACIPLTQLCERLPAAAISDSESPNNIVNTLLGYCQEIRSASNVTPQDAELLESYIVCIRTIAATHEKKFLPYATKTLELLLDVMSREDDLYIDARGNACSATGEIASAIGRDALKPYLDRISQSLISGMQKKHYPLRANIHATWAQLALVLKEEFVQFLPEVMPNIIRVLDFAYGQPTHDGDDENEDDDEEYEPEMGEEITEEEMEEIDEERRFALLCYKAAIEATQAEFAPFADQAFETLDQNAREYSEEIRPAVAGVFGAIPLIYPLEKPPVVGVSASYPDNVKDIFKRIKQILYFFIHFGTEQSSVDASLNALTRVLSIAGQAPVMDTPSALKSAVALATSILQGKAICQLTPDSHAYATNQQELLEEMGVAADEDEDEEEEEEEEEPEASVPAVAAVPASSSDHSGCKHGDGCEDDMSKSDGVEGAALELLVQLAKVRGPSFEESLNSIWPLLSSKFFDHDYKGYAIGCAADIVVAVGDTPAYVKEIVDAALSEMNTKTGHWSTGRCSAYALGVLFLKAKPETMAEYVAPAYAAIKTWTQASSAAVTSNAEKNDERNEAVLGCRDNCASALGKMLMTQASSPALPLNEAVPLFINALPLEDDFEEAQFTYSACNKLINTVLKSHPALMEPLLPKLVLVFSQVLTSDESQINDKLKAFVSKGMETLLTEEAAKKSFEELPAETQKQVKEQIEKAAATQ